MRFRKICVILTAFATVAVLIPVLYINALSAGQKEVKYINYDNYDGSRLEDGSVGEYTVVDGSPDWGEAGSSTWLVLDQNVFAGTRIDVHGTVNIVLCDGCTLTANNGIHVGNGSSLTIYAQSLEESTMGSINTGELGVTFGWAAIGGNLNESCGAITINGGKIFVSTSFCSSGTGAAIGGGGHGDATDIVINGGYITAYGGLAAPAIGGGQFGKGQNIYLNGGCVTAVAGESSTSAIGAGAGGSSDNIHIRNCTLMAEGYDSSAYPGTCHAIGDSNSQYIEWGYGEKYILKAGNSWDSVEEKSKDSVGGERCVIISRSFTPKITVLPDASSLMEGMRLEESTINGGKATCDGLIVAGSFRWKSPDTVVTANTTGYEAVFIPEHTAVCGTNAECVIKLQVSPFVYIDYDKDGVMTLSGQVGSKYTVLDTQTTSWKGETEGAWYLLTSDTEFNDDITVSGNVRLLLCDNARLTALKGIHMGNNDSLTIYAQSLDEDTVGSLIATGSDFDAGIGGRTYCASTIIINGGRISATGDRGGAGIGGGLHNGASVTINGGFISATGGISAAGIGGGRYNRSPGENKVDVSVVINGGLVIAEPGTGCTSAIGNGSQNADGEIADGSIDNCVISVGSHSKIFAGNNAVDAVRVDELPVAAYIRIEPLGAEDLHMTLSHGLRENEVLVTLVDGTNLSNAKIIAAAYREGKMLCAVRVTGGSEMTAALFGVQSGDVVRCFVLNTDYCPYADVISGIVE